MEFNLIPVAVITVTVVSSAVVAETFFAVVAAFPAFVAAAFAVVPVKITEALGIGHIKSNDG